MIVGPAGAPRHGARMSMTGIRMRENLAAALEGKL